MINKLPKTIHQKLMSYISFMMKFLHKKTKVTNKLLLLYLVSKTNFLQKNDFRSSNTSDLDLSKIQNSRKFCL